MNDSYVKKAKKNIVSNVFQMIINLVISFAGRWIFVRILDAGYLGINGLFSNILSILSLADLGMTTAMMYHLYQPIAENNQKRIQQLVAFFRKMYIIIAFSVLCLGLCIMPFLKYIINLEEEIPFLYGYYILSLLNVVVSYLFVYRTTLIVADQKNYVLNKCINIFKIITFVAQVTILILFKNYFLYLLVAFILGFACNIYQNKIALELYPFLRKKTDDIDAITKQNIFTDIKALFIYRISGTIQTNTDNILISIFVGTVYVGYYSNYSMIVTQIISIISLIFSSIKATVGNIIADVNATTENKWSMYRMLELFNFWVVAFCSIALFVLLDDFIFLFFGKEYVLGIGIVFAVVLNFYTSHIRQTIWTYRETNGLFEEVKYITMVTAIINIALSVLFGYFWGIFGILCATILARMVYAWWKEPQILFGKVFHREPAYYYKFYIKRVFLCAMVCGMTYFLANMLVMSNLYLSFLYKCIVCAFVPNVVFYLVYRNSEEFRNLIRIVLKR